MKEVKILEKEEKKGCLFLPLLQGEGGGEENLDACTLFPVTPVAEAKEAAQNYDYLLSAVVVVSFQSKWEMKRRRRRRRIKSFGCGRCERL